MEEQLISAETAKLAKEKGLELHYDYFYTEEDGLCSIISDGEILNIYDYNLDQIGYRYDCNGDFWYNEDSKEFYCANKYYATTQSLLQKWIRDVHNIHPDIWYNTLTNKWRNDSIMFLSNSVNEFDEDNMDEYETYEQVLEACLVKMLQLIDYEDIR